MTEEQLKELIVGELDIVEFLDIIDMDIAELIDIIWDSLDEERREKCERAVR